MSADLQAVVPLPKVLQRHAVLYAPAALSALGCQGQAAGGY